MLNQVYSDQFGLSFYKFLRENAKSRLRKEPYLRYEGKSAFDVEVNQLKFKVNVDRKSL